MSTFVVTIFPDEAKAYEAIHVFTQLHTEGSITLFDTTVVQRQADGTLAIKQRSPTGAVTTGVGALVGALIGLFGGPVGAAIGAAAGGVAGGGTAYVHGEVSDEFLEDLAKKMSPGSFAVLAEVSEHWTAPIDTRMAELGGKVLREKRSDVVGDLIEKRTQAHKAEDREGIHDDRRRPHHPNIDQRWREDRAVTSSSSWPTPDARRTRPRG